MNKAFILAAGRGDRMRPLTDHTPKPLIEVGGRPLIEHHLLGLQAAGVEAVIVNLGWLGPRLRERLGDGERYGLSIAYSDEGWPALETGGALQRALPLLGEAPFLLVNADVYTDYPFSKLVTRAHNWPVDTLAHLVLVDNPPHHPQGDFTLRDQHVIEPPSSLRLTFAGLSIIDPRLLDNAPGGTFSVVPLLRAAARQGRLTAERHAGLWSDVGTPERLLQLQAHLHSSSSVPSASP
ncbi:N-acetylmuramate alpha-1-phosphate uridylyltransferase MurU [Solimonas terrae]